MGAGVGSQRALDVSIQQVVRPDVRRARLAGDVFEDATRLPPDLTAARMGDPPPRLKVPRLRTHLELVQTNRRCEDSARLVVPRGQPYDARKPLSTQRVDLRDDWREKLNAVDRTGNSDVGRFIARDCCRVG